MEYQPSRDFSARAVRAHQMYEPLLKVAFRWAPMLAAGTRVRTGQTAGSTHVESGHVAHDGRPAVRLMQRNVSVPLNFRLDRDYMIRSVSGAR